MKRTIIILILLGTALCGHAQTDTLVSTVTQDSACRRVDMHIDLGLAAGATLFFGGDNHSPYYSKYGFSLQLPLMTHWRLSPHWQFSTGLRYDFNWNPLYYNVEPSGNWDNDQNMGLQFLQTPTTATQKAYAYISYLGIPFEFKWYPNAQYKNRLAIALDLYAGYAVTRYFHIDNIPTPGSGVNHPGLTVLHSSAIQPWKLEVGLTLSTDVIGLTHGLRLFTNLLPTYKDPATGEKFYTSGVTLFL